MTGRNASRQVPYGMTLAILSAGYFFNYFDRVLMSVLGPHIKAEFGLSDTQFGLLTGPAFVAIYATAALLLGRLADSLPRRRLLATTLIVWSLFTGATGLVTSFIGLLIMRAGVGMGEAGYVPASFSLLTEKVAVRNRLRVFSAFSGIGMCGMIGAFIGAGTILPILGWRWAFILAAIPGLAIAALVAMLITEQKRDGSDGLVAERLGLGESLRRIISNRTVVCMLTGSALSGFANIGIVQWLPVYLSRVYHMPAKDIAFVFGPTLTSGMVCGYLFGGIFGHRLAQRSMATSLWLPVICCGIVTLLYWIILNTGPGITFVVLVFLAGLVGNAHTSANGAALQSTADPNLRATVAGLLVLANNAVGAGLSPFLVGWFSDLLTPGFGVEALRVSLLIVTTTTLLAIPIFEISRRDVRRQELAGAPEPAIGQVGAALQAGVAS